ncbi:hypothetical protein [Paraburkholderia sp. RAU2J]|uniref:hypothetical protein n=1 Tax=Paraburkholderia sp. RAU2J TaxID=1938810 RepID=UPI000EAC525D|nr:hypothetical protein [Paraburkholderia sp. RAU2J]
MHRSLGKTQIGVLGHKPLSSAAIHFIRNSVALQSHRIITGAFNGADSQCALAEISMASAGVVKSTAQDNPRRWSSVKSIQASCFGFFILLGTLQWL